MAAGAGVATVAGVAAGAGFAAGAAALASISAMTVPLLTLSPNFTEIEVIVPAASAGTSIVALSDSRTSNGCSFSIVSPTFTNTSMTGTSE